jgi:hypothetical protein
MASICRAFGAQPTLPQLRTLPACLNVTGSRHAAIVTLPCNFIAASVTAAAAGHSGIAQSAH